MKVDISGVESNIFLFLNLKVERFRGGKVWILFFRIYSILPLHPGAMRGGSSTDIQPDFHAR